MPKRVVLPAGRCAIWLDRTPASPCPADLELLDAAEQAANQRLTTAALRARHARAHALLRRALSQLGGKAAAEWRLVTGHNGRPRLADRQEDLDFNLTHSGPYVACVISKEARVGIDVEATGRRIDFDTLLPQVTSRTEQKWLASCNPQAARTNFFRIWVLKEAYAKSLGEGLGLPFRDITLMPDPEGGIVADLHAVNDRPEDWNFAQYDVDHDAVLAVAVRGERANAANITFEIVEGAELLSPLG